jgi:hypothetical protein
VGKKCIKQSAMTMGLGTPLRKIKIFVLVVIFDILAKFP